MESLSFVSETAFSSPTREAVSIEHKAKEFEALMLAELIKPMFESAKSETLFGGDGAEQSIFGSMLQEKYAEAMAERGGIGIADQVKAALIDLQGTQSITKGTGS